MVLAPVPTRGSDPAYDLAIHERGQAGPRLTLPVAVSVFPRDIPRLPRSWIEDTYTDLIYYGQARECGDFAALEQPKILTSEIRPA